MLLLKIHLLPAASGWWVTVYCSFFREDVLTVQYSVHFKKYLNTEREQIKSPYDTWWHVWITDVQIPIIWSQHFMWPYQKRRSNKNINSNHIMSCSTAFWCHHHPPFAHINPFYNNLMCWKKHSWIETRYSAQEGGAAGATEEVEKKLISPDTDGGLSLLLCCLQTHTHTHALSCENP